MSKAMIFAFVVMMAVVALSAPFEEMESLGSHEKFDSVEEFDGAIRMKRATCDLISAFGAGDSVCAARCIVMGGGRTGGWCEKGVCHCRK